MFTEAKPNITVLGLTNPDVNFKRMHQLYIDRLKDKYTTKLQSILDQFDCKCLW